MRDLISWWSKYRSEVLYYLVLGIFVFAPLSQKANSWLLIGAAVVAITMFRLMTDTISLLRRSWDLLLFYVVSVAGLIYTDYPRSGLSVLETRLAFVAIPLIFSQLGRLQERRQRNFCWAFVFGLCFACITSLGHSALQFARTRDITSFLHNNLTNFLQFQPTYVAYYCIFAITFLLFQIYYNGIKPYLFGAVIVFLFGVLLLTGGQTAFIGILFIFSFFLLKYMVEEKKNITQAAVVGLAIVLMIVMFGYTGEVHDEHQLFTDTWDRFVIWKSALDASPSLLLGVGTGASRQVLDQYYLTHGMEEFAFKGYNSHNQFIQLLFSNGLFGLVTLVILLARPLYRSLKNDYAFGILAIFPFMLYGMTEVFLGRYQGIVFFVLLHQAVMLRTQTEEEKIIKIEATPDR